MSEFCNACGETCDADTFEASGGYCARCDKDRAARAGGCFVCQAGPCLSPVECAWQAADYAEAARKAKADRQAARRAARAVIGEPQPLPPATWGMLSDAEAMERAERSG